MTDKKNNKMILTFHFHIDELSMNFKQNYDRNKGGFLYIAPSPTPLIFLSGRFYPFLCYVFKFKRGSCRS